MKLSLKSKLFIHIFVKISLSLFENEHKQPK